VHVGTLRREAGYFYPIDLGVHRWKLIFESFIRHCGCHSHVECMITWGLSYTYARQVCR
jgi:hypothetical protein